MSYIYSFIILSGACVCRDVSPTSQMRVEIRMRIGHLLWAKKENKAGKVIDLQKLFDDYSTTKTHELMVPGE